MRQEQAFRPRGRTTVALKEALTARSRACPVCTIVVSGLHHHVHTLFYELVNDGPTRTAIREASGFCRFHARSIAEHADALGSALIFEDVVTSELRRLGPTQLSNPVGREPVNLFRRLLGKRPHRAHTYAPCPLCQTECGIEQRAIDSLLQGLADPEFATLWTRSRGLCLPHFRLAGSRCRVQGSWDTLIEHENCSLATLRDELNDLARTFDYHFQNEPCGDESDAWRRALAMTSGWYDGR